MVIPLSQIVSKINVIVEENIFKKFSLLILVWVFVQAEYFSCCLNNCRANVMKTPAINEGIQGGVEANESNAPDLHKGHRHRKRQIANY